MDFDWELERLGDDSDHTPTGMDDPMDLDWDLNPPLADGPDSLSTAIDSPGLRPGLLQFAAIAGGDCSVFTVIGLLPSRCDINPCSKPVQSGTKTPPLAIPTSTTVISTCSKCGSTKKSSKRSCCARGGAWFKNCGDAGNPKFDHTWAEGLRACRSGL